MNMRQNNQTDESLPDININMNVNRMGRAKTQPIDNEYKYAAMEDSKYQDSVTYVMAQIRLDRDKKNKKVENDKKIEKIDKEMNMNMNKNTETGN